MSKAEMLLRGVETTILAAILAMAVMIYRGLPPQPITQSSIDRAEKSHRPELARSLRAKIPLVAIEGQVEVVSSLEDPLVIQTDPTGGHPLDIEQPVEVEIGARR